jgi:lipoic acid synthetase
MSEPVSASPLAASDAPVPVRKVGKREGPLPLAYRREIPAGPLFNRVNDVLEAGALNTICVSGKCPNRGECFSRGSLAFMILGDTCTRKCGFCAVKAGNPGGVVDATEPVRLAQAAAALNLRHVVVTAVARDDLKDGGAAIFAECVRELHAHLPSAVIEVLTSDFEGRKESIDELLMAEPEIFNHNIETVERLTPQVRSKAQYRRSLEVLRYAKEHRKSERMKTKSGLMLGLGETEQEIEQTLVDLRSIGCDYLTIGQYLQPSSKHLLIQRFVQIEDFDRWKARAFGLGFERVASGPLVRSSYFADQLHEGDLPAAFPA